MGSYTKRTPNMHCISGGKSLLDDVVSRFFPQTEPKLAERTTYSGTPLIRTPTG